MKTRIYTTALFAVLLVTVVLGGCRRDEEEETPVTTDDAADVVTYALQDGSGGCAAQTSEAASYASDEGLRTTQSIQCGVPFDTTVSFTYSGNVTASYSLQWHLLLNCDSLNIPQSLNFSSPYNGNYNGPLMQSSNSGNLSWTITGLGTGNTVPYTFNGSFTRTGSHTSKVRNQSTFSSDLQVTVTSLTVDKTTEHITGGNGSLSLTCQSSTGTSYSFSGTIVFNSNGTATLTINNTNYTISLY
ncbi:MAG: hypothetical protein FD123_2469 [Bacteroidetes bacterium]|nr:MAG: hypothetical protein FD123_2469 [Bacteroidota bacterium]